MNFTLEEKAELIMTVSEALQIEREKYFTIKDMTQEEMEEWIGEIGIEEAIEKQKVFKRIKRLISLKNKLSQM